MKIDKIVVRSNQEEEIKDLTTAFPYTWHRMDMKQKSVPWHWHEEVEFCYVVEGTIDVVTINHKYTFYEKDAFFINTKVLCSMKRNDESDSAVIDSHLFHPIFLSGHYKSVYEMKYIAPVIQNNKVEIIAFRHNNPEDFKVIRMLRQATQLKGQPGEELFIRNIFSEIWFLLLQSIERMPKVSAASNQRNQERMQNMMAYIHQNYGEKVTLESIADSAMISTRECIRCFRNSINKAPIEYLMDYRLEIAKKLLKETEYSITEIALHVGFSSNAYFGKVFREKIGMTPAAFRKQK